MASMEHAVRLIGLAALPSACLGSANPRRSAAPHPMTRPAWRRTFRRRTIYGRIGQIDCVRDALQSRSLYIIDRGSQAGSDLNQYMPGFSAVEPEPAPRTKPVLGPDRFRSDGLGVALALERPAGHVVNPHYPWRRPVRLALRR